MTDLDLERLKHKNAIELEKLKWTLKEKELSFLEAGQHLRSLNQQLWQVPGMAIAVTGGIWFGAASINGELPKALALLFAAIVDILTIFVLWRLRKIIQIQIDLQNKFNNRTESKGRIVVICWSTLLALAATLSILGSLNTKEFSIVKTSPTQATYNYLYPERIEIKNE
ncbi:hypothetical protein [Stutzerimonas nitrititolerans]|uniref:hypothetical protein n=1 Tax=Stutzerimonas nitrititolerans TaxID=2482751 RepID=UPI002899289C|nr:hypothetical protein [Stutzerimonas nitrititolerans]